jgi:hypothetical protein
MWAGVPVLCSKYAGCAEELLPATQIFDPLSPESFNNALAMAIQNSVYPSDCSTLLPWQEVGAMICRSLDSGVPISRDSLPEAVGKFHSSPRTYFTERDCSIDPKPEATT